MVINDYQIVPNDYQMVPNDHQMVQNDYQITGIYKTRSGFFSLSTVFRYIVYVLYEVLFSSRKIISFKYNDL